MQLYLKIGGDEQRDVVRPRDGVKLIPPATDDHRHEEAEYKADWNHSRELIAVVGDHLERPNVRRAHHPDSV